LYDQDYGKQHTVLRTVDTQSKSQARTLFVCVCGLSDRRLEEEDRESHGPKMGRSAMEDKEG
jgi:hypothetical protein